MAHQHASDPAFKHRQTHAFPTVPPLPANRMAGILMMTPRSMPARFLNQSCG